MSDRNVRRLGDEKEHYWLALSMAQATGVELQAALDAGEITHGDWAEVVTRCRGCGWTQGCKGWLADQEGGSIGDVPQACPNAAFFESMLSPDKPSDEPPQIR